MNLSNLMKQLTAFGLAAAAAGFATADAPTQAVPAAKTIRVLSVPGADAASPDAAVWKKAPVTQVALQPAFPGHPAIVGTPRIAAVAVQVVRSPDRLFVRLAWDDPAENGKPGNTTQFSDGVAVQFPVNGKGSTPPFMGDVGNRVNIWHWRAQDRVDELVAGGFGTATSLRDEGGVTGAGARTSGGWQVVLSRKLEGSKEGVNLKRFREIPVSFAAWDGANEERDGLKAVTLAWQKLRF